MSVKVQIPLPLRGLTGGLSEVEATGSTIREIIDDLEASHPGVTVYGPKDRTRRLSVVPFNIEGWSPDEVGAVLDQAFDIKVRTGLHCAPAAHKVIGTYPHGSVRASVGCFNTLTEIDSLVDALKKIAGTGPSRLAADKAQSSPATAH